jgi:hypothetical protein
MAGPVADLRGTGRGDHRHPRRTHQGLAPARSVAGDERMGQASGSRSRAELAALTADLPVGRMDAPARPPTAKDVRIGVGASIAAAGVVAAMLLWHPDNALAFMMFLAAAVTVLVVPIVTVGMMVDVRHQRSSPPWGTG